MNKSYPTNPGVAWWGLTAFSDSFWKSAFRLECPWHSLDRKRFRVPVIQRSLPAPSCRGASHICGLLEGPGKHPSRFWSSVLGVFCWMGFGQVFYSPLLSCRTWRRNRFECACVSWKTGGDSRKEGLSVIFLIVPVSKLKVFPNRYT